MLTFPDRLPKNPQIPTFKKIPPLVAELFHTDRQTDRQTDMMKPTVSFRNFVNAPNNSVPTAQRTQFAPIKETNLLMLLSEIQNCWYNLRYLQLETTTHHFTVWTLLRHINGGDVT